MWQFAFYSLYIVCILSLHQPINDVLLKHTGELCLNMDDFLGWTECNLGERNSLWFAPALCKKICCIP